MDSFLLTADTSDSQSLAVRNASFTVARMVTMFMEILMSICQLHVQVGSKHPSLSTVIVVLRNATNFANQLAVNLML